MDLLLEGAKEKIVAGVAVPEALGTIGSRALVLAFRAGIVSAAAIVVPVTAAAVVVEALMKTGQRKVRDSRKRKLRSK